jgi:MFS family permease
MWKVAESYKGIPKEAVYLTYAVILPSVAYGMFYTDISYFLTTVQGVSYDVMGQVISIMGVSTFVASIFLGIAADVYGRKKMLVGGNILASLILAAFALTTNPALLSIVAVGEGVAEAAVLASSSALLAEKVADSKRNSVFSLYSFAQSIAFGVGSIAIPAVVIFELFGFTSKEGHVLLYVAMAILSAISTLIILKVGESTGLKKPHSGIRDLFPKKSKNILAKYIFTSAIISFGAGMVVPLMTAWFSSRYGISDAISGPILGISSILIGLGTLAAPMMAERFGLIKAIVLTQAVSTIFMFATPLSPEFASASIVYSIRALLMNMATPLQQSMIMGLVAKEERGAASGLSGALWRLPNALSTFVGAWLMGIGLLAEPFFIASLLYLVSIILYWHYFRESRMPEEQVCLRS